MTEQKKPGTLAELFSLPKKQRQKIMNKVVTESIKAQQKQLSEAEQWVRQENPEVHKITMGTGTIKWYPAATHGNFTKETDREGYVPLSLEDRLNVAKRDAQDDVNERQKHSHKLIGYRQDLVEEITRLERLIWERDNP